MRAAVRSCLVFRRDGAKPTALPGGHEAHLCADCARDDRRVDEAKRRIEEAGR